MSGSQEKPTGIRRYGIPPYGVVLLHGGPGAPGSMAPVARELGRTVGVLEPLQSADSLEGQIEELKTQLGDAIGIDLVGSSWGAVLALFFAARFPGIVRQLVLIGSAVFDVESSNKCRALRQERLPGEIKAKVEELSGRLRTSSEIHANAILLELHELTFGADCFDPITRDDETIVAQYLINQRVWNDFKVLRDSDRLKSEFAKVKAPTVVIHGDYDPHPIEGVVPFLKSCLPKIDVFVLEQCGHLPWLERRAKDQFYKILKDSLRGGRSKDFRS